MIFDDMDSDIDIPAQPRFLNQETNIRTSLDDFLSNQDQNETSSVQHYEVFQIQINKSFLADFKTNKKPKAITVEHKIQRSEMALIIKETKEDLSKYNYRKNDSIKSGVCSVSEENVLSSSDDSSMEECDVEEATLPDNNNQVSLRDKPSIEEMLQIKEEEEVSVQNAIEVKSLQLPAKRKQVNLFIRKIRTVNDFSTTNIDVNDNFKLESFVSLNEINFRKRHIKAENEICAICQSTYKLKDFIARLCSCSHVFHKKCIDEWINKSDRASLRCPVCDSTM